MDAEASSSLFPFSFVILAWLCWIVLVGILLPRLLGRTLAFVANRFLRDASHISIPSLYIYPLSGRVVAHSVRYTIPNGTVSVEELVLQCRWWRKIHDVQFRQLLTVDDPHTLDPVAAEQQAMERENAAFFVRRFWYRLRRWWHATAVTRDPNNSVEPRPLISLICVGLRARIVNDEKNYAHVKKVLALAKATIRRSAQFDGDVPPEFDVPLTNDVDTSHPSALSAEIQESPSSSSTYSSVESVDSKPWQQRVLEFVSLRISDGAFYFCDMGMSPLVRLSVNSAKLRYRYGAAACSADECRKRIRMRVSGLKLSVSTQSAVEQVVRMPSQPSSNPKQSGEQSDEEVNESNTDRMIRRILLLGYEGLSAQKSKAESPDCWNFCGERGARRRLRSVLPRLTNIYTGKRMLRMARTPQVLPCSDVMNATTAVIDYVFDEPGFEQTSENSTPDEVIGNIRQEGSSDTLEKLPAPVCRVSILLRGCSFAYDFQAIADIERVMERLQPVFYDLRSLARKVRSGEAKRSADGIQIEIEATPRSTEERNEDRNGASAPLITVPFIPKEKTWRGLLAMNIRNWSDMNGKQRKDEGDGELLPESRLSVFASRITFRTEVPYHEGVAQKSVVSMKDVVVNAEGVVDMPVGSSNTISITRVIHYPVCWNDEHVVSADVQASNAEFLYLPDTFRIIDDINTTFQALSKKPESVRYFVPFRETTRILVTNSYRMILSSGHDNAWNDIHAGEADEYGRVVVFGQDGELILSPSTATEFVQDSTVLSWSLSLPNAAGKLDFSILEDSSTTNSERNVTGGKELTNAGSSAHQKGRTSSLAHFVKSLETFGGHSHDQSVPERKPFARHFGIELLRAGKSCKLSGKVVLHEKRLFLGTNELLFLDSVNRSDIHFKTSGIQMDLNPHHVTHILNFTRNYAGPGLHTISASEGSQLTKQRISVARQVLREARFPTAAECLTIGLPYGTAISSREDHTALDDVLCVTFQIDQLLVRLHNQPHALCTFDMDTPDVCSLGCRKLYGFLHSNRLGLELSCSPDSSKALLFLREGCRELHEDERRKIGVQHIEKAITPTATIANLQITRRSWANREWGPYHSELKVDIGSITGCISDTSATRIARFASHVAPDALHDDSVAIAAMLSVENIEVQVSEVDLLVLSASSAFSTDRSGQMSRFIPSDRLVNNWQTPESVDAPKFLSGVSQVQLPIGLRFVMSNLASENVATRSRVLIPDITADVLMPSGGKLIPWVDNVTMRAQVAHATMLRRDDIIDGFGEVGLLRRVAKARGIAVDLNYDTRPLLWSSRVTSLQKVHIARLKGQGTYDSSSLGDREEGEQEEGRSSPFARNSLRMPWRNFLDGASKASSIEELVDRKVKDPHHLDCLSVFIVSNAVVLITPESLEVANDVLVRTKEAISYRRENINSTSTGSGTRTGVSISDVLVLWRDFECTRRIPRPMAEAARPSTSMRAVETRGLTFVLTSLTRVGRGREYDTFLSSRDDIDEVKLCAPFGAKLFHMMKTSAPRARENAENEAKPVNASSKMTSLSINRGSIPSMEVQCNGQGFIDFAETTFVSRQTMKGMVMETSSKDGHNSNDVRNSRVGSVASVTVGSKNSALHSYACFGRVLSIFVLLSRTLGLEASALFNLRRKRKQELCELLFSSRIEDLRNGKPRAVRNFFVEVIRTLHPSEGDRAATTERVALDSDHFRIPSHVLRNIVTKQRNAYPIVDSVDISVQNFSLKAADHAIVSGDLFQCKGGFRSEGGKGGPHLDGRVLNANLGAIWLSIRDDTAADALRMVSEVASFVRAAAFSIPTIRHDESGREQRQVESSELLSFSYKNENLLRGNGIEILQSPGPFTRSGKSLWRSSVGDGSRGRGSYSRHPRSSWRSNNTLRRRGASSGGAMTRNDQNMETAGLRSWNGRAINLDNQLMRARAHPKLSAETNENPVKRKKTTAQPVVVESEGMAAQTGTSRPASQVGDKTASVVLHSPEPWVNNIGNDEQYTSIAVRTAGESGPPRKRAKHMVRLNTIVPPAFLNISPQAVPRLRTPSLGGITDDKGKSRCVSSPQRKSSAVYQERDAVHTETQLNSMREEASDAQRTTSGYKEDTTETPSSVTLFVSCHKIACHYFRGKSLQMSGLVPSEQEADVRFLINEPRLTYMSSPQKGSHSVVVTSSSAQLQSANDPNCVLTGSIGKIGVTMSIAQRYVPSTLPKLIMSAQLTEFATTLHATDLKSVLRFRESFKKDIKGILSAFVRTKNSVSEMARATRLSSSKILYPGRTVYSTLAFDLLCERSKVKLEGFHPKDHRMTVSYLLDGMFFSVVASQDDKAALTLGLRLYGHGLSLASPSWESIETLRFPSLDARGVQWGEATGLPTILKVTAEPLMNSTSVQGLRHVLFTVAGLMAFQNVCSDAMEPNVGPSTASLLAPSPTTSFDGKKNSEPQASGAPFTRSFAAWERTKGVRMDMSIRPMSLSLVSGQVLTLFDVGAITGIFEWNKLVQTGVQLHTAVSVPRISLTFMRMPSSDFTIADIRPNEKRTSMSIALERSRIDLLKTQEDLAHTFTFRVNIFAVSGQIRPWKLLLDAASWADEQEFVADLQAINYSSVSSARQRHPRVTTSDETLGPAEHRVILIGANVQRFILAVPLLSTEEYSSSRLALRATELHYLSRQRLNGASPHAKNVMELKTHFIGILWENSPMLSTHHARIAFSVKRPSAGSTAHFGDTSVVMYPGTWRICPRKDVVLAIIEAKNRKDNKKASEKTRELLAALPEIPSYPPSSTAGDSLSYAERQNRLLFESISLKTFRTSGFIEGLDRGTQSDSNPRGRSSLVGDHVQQVSKLSVPAFSISVVRRADQRFDIVDIDFSGREGGEFPRGCLGKVSNIFTDLFGVVTADQMNEPTQNESIAQVQHSREMTRDVSVLLRFGKSLYRAQEDVNSFEAKFGFFAGKSSALLISLYTSILEEDESHSTVITGISPRLGLEITPLLSGAKVQSLRLTDARLLHGFSPSSPPHTLMHINRVTAVMEAKTLLLTRNRLSSLASVKSIGSDLGRVQTFSPSAAHAERNVMFLMGKIRPQRRSLEKSIPPEGKENRVEADIRLQMKFPANDDATGDEVNLFVERCVFGASIDRTHPTRRAHRLKTYAGFHKLIMRAQWDLLGCKLQLREALFCYDACEVPLSQGCSGSVANILNRLQFESMQYGRNTAKVNIDAIAAMWAVPGNELLVESTSISAEVAYTLQNAKTKLSGQAKKLKNEVTLLTEKDLSRDTRRGGLSYESSTLDPALNVQDAFRETDRSTESVNKTGVLTSSKSGGIFDSTSWKDNAKARSRNILMKGDELVVTMRGYQFDEARQSAEVALSGYDLQYRCDAVDRKVWNFHRCLDIDFIETRLSYVDEDRGISTDLFRIPSPKLNLTIVEDEDRASVHLQGVLLIALKHGCYYIQDFRNLVQLTIMGIEHTASSDIGESSQKTDAGEGDSKQVWNGKEAEVTVNLNPKIDVMGDLTEDMLHLNMISSRLGKAEAIPRQMYDFIIVPLEALSNALCDPLYR